MRSLEELRELRQLLEEDERMRNSAATEMADEEEPSDQIEILPGGMKMLQYESFLVHQRYYDDFKHADIPLINFGTLWAGMYQHSTSNIDNAKSGIQAEARNLIIEQQKALGKGGFVWDAGYILAEHLFSEQSVWNPSFNGRVLELGAGTGVTGLAIAKFAECSVTITDLPELLDLMKANIDRNFSTVGSSLGYQQPPQNGHESDDGNEEKKMEEIQPTPRSAGEARAQVLRWGNIDDYPSGKYDVILGADIVASIYNCEGLVNTMYDLSHRGSIIYLSYKHRTDFTWDELMRRLQTHFQSVKIVNPVSRNKNPVVKILEISKRLDVPQTQ